MRAGPADFRGWFASWRCLVGALARRELHRFDDFRVRRAAAKIAREVVANVVILRIGYFLEKLPRHKDESRRTEAALESAAFDKRFLHRVEVRAVLDGDDFRAVDKCREIETARDRAAIHEHRAAAAQSLPAAFACAGESEALQEIDQRVMRRHVRRDALAVQGEFDGPQGLAHAANLKNVIARSRDSTTWRSRESPVF